LQKVDLRGFYALVPKLLLGNPTFRPSSAWA
jgi:hypothetical protein